MWFLEFPWSNTVIWFFVFKVNLFTLFEVYNINSSESCRIDIIKSLMVLFWMKIWNSSAVLTENIHWVCKSICFLYVCMVYFRVCTQVCFQLISNVHIVRTIENRILFQTFEKWQNVSYGYVSYVTSEISDI